MTRLKNSVIWGTNQLFCSLSDFILRRRGRREGRSEETNPFAGSLTIALSYFKTHSSLPTDPDTLDTPARTGGEGLPCIPGRRDSEQTQLQARAFPLPRKPIPAHKITYFPPLPVAMLARQPAAAECGHSRALHTHPLTPSCPPSQSPWAAHTAPTPSLGHRHIHRYRHASPWSRKRETEPGGGLLERAATAPWHGAVRAAPAR